MVSRSIQSGFSSSRASRLSLAILLANCQLDFNYERRNEGMEALACRAHAPAASTDSCEEIGRLKAKAEVMQWIRNGRGRTIEST